MLSYLLTLTIPVSAIALLNARREYRQHGRLTITGTLLLCVMLFVPNLVLEYATVYKLPKSTLDFIGILVAAAGLGLCLAGMARFGSSAKVMCLDPGSLTRTGPYRWSRNPQYVGWFLFVLGFALNDWSWWCFGAVAVVGVSLHLLILVEEEHLRRVFGESYLEFCREVPRYGSLSLPGTT